MGWPKLPQKLNIPDLEKEVLSFWKKKNIFKKSIEQRPIDNSFTFYDGPPFATGLPHYGHLLQSYIKDSIPRYWTMRTKRVERRFGWDCHGLPIENIVEKELGIKTKSEIDELGISRFCELCKEKVTTYTDEWKDYIERAGRWVEMENSYKTMDLSYMESVWWVFKTVWEKGLIYQGKRSTWICPRCATPLSQIEVNDPAETKEIEDPSIIVKFKIQPQEKPAYHGRYSPQINSKRSKHQNSYLLAWTTTPWTIPANVLLGISPKDSYVKVEFEGELYILAEKRVEEVFKLLGRKKKDYKIIEKFKGSKLLGTRYDPVFKNMSKEGRKIYEVVAGEFISMEEGTGIVHVAPAYGEEDFELGKKEKAAMIQHLTLDGIFTSPNIVKGMWIWDDKSNEKLLTQMRNDGNLFYEGKYKHVYPHCWRCHTKLLSYTMTAWFIATTAIKEKLYKNLRQTRWIPEYAKTGRLGDWMKNLKDWCISRNRYWGTPLPVWVCSKCKSMEVIGSVEELQVKTGQKITDLHRNKIDSLTWKCRKCDGHMNRISEVLDCWFESGSMPYALPHYPFENKRWFENNFPADFIGESIEQATKWFYALLVLGTILFEKAPYKNVVCTGIILAEDGRKMSKHLHNYPDPMDLYNRTGSDAVRLFLFNSPVVKGDTMRFSEKGINNMITNLILLYWNCYKFLVTYADLHKWIPSYPQPNIEEKLKRMLFTKPKLNILDRWIVVRTADLIKEVNEAFEKYNLYDAVKPLQPYIWDLSTWYVRRVRRRCAQGDTASLETLYYSLYNFTLVAAPLMPFITDSVWQGLVKPWDNTIESVHLALIPTIDKNRLKQHKTMKQKMERVKQQIAIARKFCSLGHRLRVENKVKVRQPLSRVMVFNPNFTKNRDLEESIKEELNVREILYGLDVPKDGKWKSVKEKETKVSLDFEINTELAVEGLKREIIRAVQNARKKAGLRVGENATVEVQLPSDALNTAENVKYELERYTHSEIKFVKGPELAAKVN